MKPSILSAAVLVLVLTAQSAHAASNIGGFVSKINSIGGGSVTNDVGGGTGDPINPLCTNSPENATLLLAILCGGGLFAGRKLGRAHMHRKPVLSASL